jgi:hypothetical protein
MPNVNHGNAFQVLNLAIQNLYGAYKDLAANAIQGRYAQAYKNSQEVGRHLDTVGECLGILKAGVEPGVTPTPRTKPDALNGVPIQHADDITKTGGDVPVTTSPPAEVVKPKPVNPLGGLRKPKVQ